ncbi:3D domain-containing protein [Ammoniphilus resinae]|uniref:Uncharacterized protein YabE (DUF348 family) n=1 Tax=Ammoniphilus resinae TaxID=861532 RepID=A0ABS4GQ92_9BACL|nr:3D domain-containing protein [Ammoniphilus resinae]MBP1932441.1 uncharacterized protein YabE (DUF348 family) [Ammoniphilus resinae]
MDQERAFLFSRKFLYLVGILSILFITGMGVWFYQASQPKEVQFVVNGEVKSILTKAKTVGEFLDEQSIDLDAHDKLSPSTEEKIRKGIHIAYTDQWQVTLTIANKAQTVVTNKKTVGEILAEQKVSLGKWDKVFPAENEEVSANGKIKVNRIEKKMVEKEKSIPFNEVKRTDYLLTKGSKKVVQEGKNGKALLRYQVVYENGEEVSKELTETKVVAPAQDRVVRVGALVTVSRSGADFTARKVLENVTLTAYGPNGDPENAITASGRVATAGRSIAVDPNVIPMGNWVYIEGYGYRRAEDTGSAIKGNKIDIYFSEDQDAVHFGRKKASKVYVIGPTKP